MPITFQEFNQQGFLGILAKIFDEEDNSRILLENIGFPRSAANDFNSFSPVGFWETICQQIVNGTAPGDLETLLIEAARIYPYNPNFVRWREVALAQPTPTPRAANIPSEKTGISLIVTGYRGDIFTLFDRINTISRQLQIPEPVQRLYASNNTAAFFLVNATTTQGERLIQTLRSEQGESLNIRQVPFADYLISKIYAEGPDQGRFELNNIPASTPVSDIGRATMSQYHDQMWRDNQGIPRQAVADYTQPNGTTQRLNPDTTLHDSNIREEGTVHVSPQATAGSVNPILREQALVRVKLQIQEFAKNFPTFQVHANSIQAPTEYKLHFSTPSWAPATEPYAPPQRIDQHEVRLILPAEFPMKAPHVYWQTPIFHPNISPRNGLVCLGILAENYRPAMDFRELCQMLIDIASFQNYAIREGWFNREAAEWAFSEAGQQAIQAIGGRKLEAEATNILKNFTAAPQLRIKRFKI